MSGITSAFHSRSSHMTEQSLRDKFSHVGLNDTGEHATILMYLTSAIKHIDEEAEKSKIYLKTLRASYLNGVSPTFNKTVF